MDKLRKVFKGQEDDGDSGLLTSVTGGGDSCCPSLSWETRLKGFIACCIIGVFLSVLGVIWVFFNNFTGFALLYTIGSLTTIASTFFLRGPMSQLKSMFQETRIIATVIMLLSIILTFISALVLDNGVLCIILCIIQFLAFTWYSISYIPFARNAVKSCFNSCLA